MLNPSLAGATSAGLAPTAPQAAMPSRSFWLVVQRQLRQDPVAMTAALVFVPQVLRIAESVTTQVRRLDYIEAARMSGSSVFSIIRVHMLGSVLGPVFVYATRLLSVSMILGSGLSFLGLGVKPPEPEWGLMLNTQSSLRRC